MTGYEKCCEGKRVRNGKGRGHCRLLAVLVAGLPGKGAWRRRREGKIGASEKGSRENRFCCGQEPDVIFWELSEGLWTYRVVRR